MKTLSVAAGLLFTAGFVPYIAAILSGKAKPAKATWLVWSVVDAVILCGMYSAGDLSWQMVGCTIGTWIVALLAMKFGTSGWTNLDKACLVLAVLGVSGWLKSGNPILGIVFSLAVVVLGCIPTFSSAWKNPSQENKPAWLMFWASCVLATIAIPQWTLAYAAQPLVFLAIQSTMLLILYCHHRVPATT